MAAPITNVAIVNQSTVLVDNDVIPAVAAMQLQVDNDFSPVWHVNAKLTFFSKAQAASIPPDYWQLAVLDNSDQAGALGYHDITNSGRPLGKAFAGTDKQYGLHWTVTVSHELLEMLVDPWINLTVFDQRSNTRGRIYAYEVCDACEDEQFAYYIGQIKVSDFVTPAWFEGWRAAKSVPFDLKNHITTPFQLLNGGYISYFDATGGGWQQRTASDAPSMQHRPVVGSRRERRTVDKDRWVVSS